MRGSPSAPPSFGAGPTVLTAAKVSPFRGFSNSTYTKSHDNWQIARGERLNSKEQQLLTTPFFLATAKTCSRAAIRVTPLIISKSGKASVGKEARKGMLTGSVARSAREAATRRRRRVRPTSPRPWRMRGCLPSVDARAGRWR